jgi:hypothetical protein
MIRLYLWFCRVLFCCTRTMGEAEVPGIPCALLICWRVDQCIARTFRAAGSRTHILFILKALSFVLELSSLLTSCPIVIKHNYS